jgi:hypothetical protein
MRQFYVILLVLLCLTSCRTVRVCVPDRCQREECQNQSSFDSSQTAYDAEAEQSEYLHGFPWALGLTQPKVDFHTILNSSSESRIRIDARGCRPPPTSAFAVRVFAGHLRFCM